MDNDQFSETQKRVTVNINRALFILSQEFSQRTQEASLVLKEILAPKTLEEQTVVLSSVISRLRRTAIEEYFNKKFKS